jgi:hypothetical protein
MAARLEDEYGTVSRHAKAEGCMPSWKHHFVELFYGFKRFSTLP